MVPDFIDPIENAVSTMHGAMRALFCVADCVDNEDQAEALQFIAGMLHAQLAAAQKGINQAYAENKVAKIGGAS